jgi:hypothetical protein
MIGFAIVDRTSAANESSLAGKAESGGMALAAAEREKGWGQRVGREYRAQQYKKSGAGLPLKL